MRGGAFSVVLFSFIFLSFDDDVLSLIFSFTVTIRFFLATSLSELKTISLAVLTVPIYFYRGCRLTSVFLIALGCC